MNDLRNKWDKAVHAADDRRYIAGRLGKADAAGTVTIDVPNHANYLYVSLGPEGDQGVSMAMNLGVPKYVWLPIRLKQENNQLYIVSMDYTPGRLEAFFNNQTIPGNVGFHNHRIGSGLEYELEALRMEMGRVIPSANLSVGVRPFRYFYNGSWDTWESGSTIDLTTYKPASGKWAWVLVGVNPSTNALVANKCTDQDDQASLTVDLIDTITFNDYIPCAAFQMAESDTSTADLARWHDAHGWFNRSIESLDDLTDVTITTPAENDVIWYDGAGWINGGGHRLNIDVAQSLTIVSGALDIDDVDAQHGLIDVHGESSTDDTLTTINNGQLGDVIILIATDPTTYGEITVDDSGNINVVGEVVLNDTGDCLVLVKTAAGWNPVGGTGVPGVSVGEAVALQISGAATNITATYNEGLIDIRPVTPGSDDTLTTINGGVEGQVIVLYVSDPTTYGDVTISSGGNINVPSDVVLDTAGDALALVYTDVGWNPIGGGGGGGGASAFTDLSDVPSSYSGQAGKFTAVNSGETALEFIAPGLAAAAYHYIVDKSAFEIVATTSGNAASKGNTIIPDTTLWIRALEYAGDISSGATLVAKICTDDGSGNIDAVLATSAPYTAGASIADISIWLYFDEDVELTAGTKYYALICWTNAASGTTLLPMYYDETVLSVPNRVGAACWARVEDVDPGNGDTVIQGTTGSNLVMGYMFRTADTPEIAGFLTDTSDLFNLDGQSGGQDGYGGTDSGDDLNLRSTSHATKGNVNLADDGGNVGLGTGSPVGPVHGEDEYGAGFVLVAANNIGDTETTVIDYGTIKCQCRISAIAKFHSSSYGDLYSTITEDTLYVVDPSGTDYFTITIGSTTWTIKITSNGSSGKLSVQRTSGSDDTGDFSFMIHYL